MKEKLKSAFYIFFPLLVGGIVSFFISNQIDYTSLERPPLAPPKILFPIAWTIIYLLMGISYYIFKKRHPEKTTIESTVYYIQLFINALWSIIFFVWKLRLVAVVWIILLDIVVLYLLYLFFQKEKICTYLNIPYLIWILFATYLTTGIYLLN